MGTNEHARAEALHHVPRRVDLEDRREVGAVAALEHPDALAVGVDVDADRLAPLALIGQLHPILDGAIRIGRIARLRVGPRTRDRDRRDRRDPEHPPDLVHFTPPCFETRVGRAAYCLTYFITRLGPTSAP